MVKSLYSVLLTSLFLSVNCFAANWQAQIVKQFNSASIILQSPDGQTVFSHTPNKAMVPASILKIATADAVISTLGKDYRIPTKFYLTEDHYLGIKGFGDPTLVSESLASIAIQLKKYFSTHPPKDLQGFWFDTDFFAAQLKIHGQSHSNNPYDSSIGAIVANFNTIYIKKSHDGKIVSAEPQTPLTATAQQLAEKLSPGKHRINLGQNDKLTMLYFAELLQVFLKKEGINIPLHIVNKSIPKTSTQIFVHQSLPLSEIIRKLLAFSNNFIANQLLLIFGATQKGGPANLDKSRQALSEFLIKTIGIDNFTLEEGSGLSRKNQFSARQMLNVLLHFKPYQDLLKTDQKVFQAKTGTLRGVSSYAGYILSPSGDDYPFVIMLKNPKRTSDRKKIANLLYEGVLETQDSPN